MTDELIRWRADTPAAQNGRIHLNNAGASLMPRPVLAAIQDHLKREVELGGYEAAEAASFQLDACYQSLGTLVGAGARNIAVVENATVAVAQALSAFDFNPGDTIVTSRNDYVSNQLMFLALAERRGVLVVRAEELPEGGVDPDSVRALIQARRPALVTLTWVPTNSGLVQDAAAVGEACRDAGVPYLLDACQVVGQMPIDVAALHCDFLAATARKFLRGPRGIGFLFVSDRMLAERRYPLTIDMRGAHWTGPDTFELVDSARRFENWENAYALILGMGAAAQYALDIGLDRIGERANALAARARTGLARLPRVRVLDRGSHLCAIATLSIDGIDAREIVLRLREEAINTSSTAQEYALLDMQDKNAHSVLRIAPHYFNTEREIDIAVSALEEFVT